MWYIADLVFAKPKLKNRRRYRCESSNVLIEAESAEEAYKKAQAWARRYEDEGTAGMRFVGIEELRELVDSPVDGAELGGRFFLAYDIWGQAGKRFPPKKKLSVFRFRHEGEKTLEEFLSPTQLRALLDTFDAE
jgi:hypothetical protein